MLNEWAGQGRIVPTTTLVEEATGRRLMAANVPGLALMNPPGPGTTSGGPFAPSNASYGSGPFGRAQDGSYEANTSFMLSGISVVLCACLPCIGFVPAGIAVFYGVTASRKGARLGSSAVAVAILALVIQLAGSILGPLLLRGLVGG